LVPADAHAYRAKGGLPNLEAGIARGKIEFFKVTGPVWNVRFSVTAKNGSVEKRAISSLSLKSLASASLDASNDLQK